MDKKIKLKESVMLFNQNNGVIGEITDIELIELSQNRHNGKMRIYLKNIRKTMFDKLEMDSSFYSNMQMGVISYIHFVFVDHDFDENMGDDTNKYSKIESDGRPAEVFDNYIEFYFGVNNVDLFFAKINMQNLA